MSIDNPLDSPEARQHNRNTQILQHKIYEYLTKNFPDVIMPVENDERPTLRVMPTRQNDGRVRLTIPQLAALMGVDEVVLYDPALPLVEVLGTETG